MIEIGGFVGLAALTIGLFAWIRADMRAQHAELKREIATLHEGQTELRERMARLEGLLEGLQGAIAWRAGPRDAA